MRYAGYRTFTVRPDARTGADRVRTSIRTVRGRASVDRARSEDRLLLAVEVPVARRPRRMCRRPNGRTRAAPQG
ncbi:alpha-L-rhamnosidase C-terminal domain-containing protein [Streptomyces xantholiticus]|uniref:Alpha-L-rhamnosidase C-terminal domain-containing protein n=1 Tax=Streptomyces xantholiticus TaxID=68285 RepID=A0ABV1UMJ0_9ACTN